MSLIDRYGLFEKILPNMKINKSYLTSHNELVILASLLRDEDFNTISKLLNKLTYSKSMVSTIYFLIRFVYNYIEERKHL